MLLIEDNPGDIYLAKEALGRHCPVPITLEVAKDGALAIEKLSSQNKVPDLILLDLNLPKMDGLAVLERIRAFKISAPVVILSSSNNPSDVKRAYNAGASAYIQKPLDYEDFEVVIRGICRSWIEPLMAVKR